ncbi:MAG: Rrf2 family transcriptional regulator [Weeksellaceae bacterium]
MFTKKAKYGLKAMSYLARKENNAPTLISEISENENIPLKFLQGILLSLKKHGYLDSKQGRGGGYFLKVPASGIPLTTLVRILDGPIALLPCASLNFYEKCADCQDEKNCSVNKMMIDIRDRTLHALHNQTLKDII